MKLQFIKQKYQTDAVNAICDIFNGCDVKDSLFTIPSSINSFVDIGFANKKLVINDNRILSNIQSIQSNNLIPLTDSIQNMNFTVEMETGTGKTYVYIKTIFELNKRYGFTKFIIVVPSVAIREGVNSTFIATTDHFKTEYNNVEFNYFVYGDDISKVGSFVHDTNIQIMIINIDSFNKNFRNDAKNSNIINRPSDKLLGNTPIELIGSCRPIVIIDEPQSVDNTDNAKVAISKLQPMCILRYSATHKKLYNLMYRLTPVDAYQEHLVKEIEVDSVLSKDVTSNAYVKLVDVFNKKGIFSCKIEILQLDKKSGDIKKKIVNAKTGDDICELSNELDYYNHDNHIIDNINCEPNNESITLNNGESIPLGGAIGNVDDDQLKKAQIRETIRVHLDKELQLMPLGIKVLSLFFIDEVSNYRDHDATDQKGKYAIWFEEAYSQLISQKKYAPLLRDYGSYILTLPKAVHDGYFSKDSKGRFVNSKEGSITLKDETTFELIMKDKERLLSFEEPIRFIFSHSALKEGWDNPNVFQICTLVKTRDTMTKRQKLGRGLRLCINQKGERVTDPKYNILTVIANESYIHFANHLQNELQNDNFKFGFVENISFNGISVKLPDGTMASLTPDDSVKIFNYLRNNEYISDNGKVLNKFFQDVLSKRFALPDTYEVFTPKVIEIVQRLSKEIKIRNATEKVSIKKNNDVFSSDEFLILWNKIKHKTRYKVNIPINDMKSEAIQKIKDMPKIKPEQFTGEIAKIEISKDGVQGELIQSKYHGIINYEIKTYPDLIRRLQESSQFLRKTIVDIITASGRLCDFYVNPEEFIRKTSEILLNVRSKYITNNIEYEILDGEFYDLSDIFNDDALFGYEGQNIVETPNKCVFDHVIYDSDIEEKFAELADNSDDVVLFTKLPHNFKIDTPIQKYNPDWALVLKKGNENTLYFIVETKGTNNEDALTTSERNKINCGRKHFAAIKTGIKYQVTNDFQDFVEKY